MTEGISKERLIEYRSLRLDAEELLDRIIDECKELDPWLPIDENAPKDRYILTFDYMFKSQVVSKFDEKIGLYLDRNRVAVYATHYKELSEDPKE